MTNDARKPTRSATEQALIDELFALVRELHNRKQADEIITSFEKVFEGDVEADERLSIAEHWRDFYRLRKYRKLTRRRRPTYQERMTACSACGYPVSHRHHLWDVAMHGENKVTIQLCPNCHELQHLLYNTLVRDSEYSRRLVVHALESGSVRLETAQKVLDWCRATIRYESDNGWVEQYRTTDEWLEQRLHWSEYLASHRAG
jgi:ribosomal protein L37E